jgi:divalent metal cation (Fe/Co/Zn/Cd) transporter
MRQIPPSSKVSLSYLIEKPASAASRTITFATAISAIRTGVLLSDAHRVATEIEETLETNVPSGAKVTTHLESALDHDIIHRRGD